MSKTFVVLAKPGSTNHFDTTLFVKEGFNIGAFVFTALWFLYKRMWYIGMMLFLADFICLSGFVAQEYYWAIILDITLKLWVGFSAKDWYIQSKLKEGYVMVHVMVCSNKTEAQLRFFGDYLGVLEQLKKGTVETPSSPLPSVAAPWGAVSI